MDGAGPLEVAVSRRISNTSELLLITVSFVTSYFVIHGLDTPVTQLSSTNLGYITFLNSFENIEYCIEAFRCCNPKPYSSAACIAEGRIIRRDSGACFGIADTCMLLITPDSGALKAIPGSNNNPAIRVIAIFFLLIKITSLVACSLHKMNSNYSPTSLIIMYLACYRNE